MPPRLPALAASWRSTPASAPLVTFLLPLQPFLQARNASILSSLADNPGAYNKRIRRGRGPSSGKGKTSGRGHKGQKQHGKVPARFQGGQTPQHIVQGVRGFENKYGILSLLSRSLRRAPANNYLLINYLGSRLRCLQSIWTGYSPG